MTFSNIDLLVIILYFVLVLYIGFFFKGKSKKHDSENFLLAGRTVSLPFFVASLVATWYGNILGMGEFVYTGGIVAWFCFGLPYYIAAFLFAFMLSKKIRKSEVGSIPEQISIHYGDKAGNIASIIVLTITIPAAYVLMLGTMVQMFTGWNLLLSISAGAIISVIYLFHGGLKSDILTNTAQFVFMYLGFGALVVFAIINLGSPLEMLAKLPDTHLSPLGTNNWQYVLSWYFIAFQTFIDPSFHQRCSAAKNPETSQKGVYWSIAFWVLFDTLTLLSGLYAKAYFQIDNPLLAYPSLGEAILPVFWKGVFFIAMLATVMSTFDSYAFISAVTFGKDIFSKINAFKGKSLKSLTNIGLLITSIISILMAYAIPSAIDIIYKTSSIAVPALIIPLSISYSKKYFITKKSSIIIMLSASFGTLIWMIIKANIAEQNFYSFRNIFNFEPMMIGILIASFLGLIFIKKRV